MLKIKLVVVGKIKEKFYADAINEYSKRIARFAKLEIIEINECKLDDKPTTANIEKCLNAEATEILAKLSGNIIVCDLDGQALSSIELARYIDKATLSSCISVVIGSSCGLSNAIKEQANLRLNFGNLTFPHQLMRVVAIEQIYRALTIINNVSYHK